MTSLEVFIYAGALASFTLLPFALYFCYQFGNEAVRAGKRVAELTEECARLDAALEAARMPAMYDEDLCPGGSCGKAPLGIMAMWRFKDLKPVNIANRIEFSRALATDPEDISKLHVVIETSLGVFVRTIGMLATKITKINENEIHAYVKWDDIHVGQPLTVHSLKIMFLDMVLKEQPEFYGVELTPGDVLRIGYKHEIE